MLQLPIGVYSWVEIIYVCIYAGLQAKLKERQKMRYTPEVEKTVEHAEPHI